MADIEGFKSMLNEFINSAPTMSVDDLVIHVNDMRNKSRAIAQDKNKSLELGEMIEVLTLLSSAEKAALDRLNELREEAMSKITELRKMVQ